MRGPRTYMRSEHSTSELQPHVGEAYLRYQTNWMVKWLSDTKVTLRCLSQMVVVSDTDEQKQHQES